MFIFVYHYMYVCTCLKCYLCLPGCTYIQLFTYSNDNARLKWIQFGKTLVNINLNYSQGRIQAPPPPLPP